MTRPNEDIVIKEFFDPLTYTLTYVVHDPASSDAVVIDPVWDYDQASSTLSKESFAKVKAWIVESGLRIRMVLETHAHADHVSSAQIFKSEFPDVTVAIGANICRVQETFKKIFDLPESFPTDGRQFDRLIRDQESFQAGSLKIEAIATPGHTPACMSYKIGSAVFVGDAIFMPDYGTGRCDFPAGSAETLYSSIVERLFALPDDTRLYTGHDYQPGGRPLQYMATVGEQKSKNIQLKGATTRADYVKFRTERDRTLSAPKLLLPSVQLNIDGGRLPQPHANGVSYLSIPVTSGARK